LKLRSDSRESSLQLTRGHWAALGLIAVAIAIILDQSLMPLLKRQATFHCVHHGVVDHECLVAEYTKALTRVTGWLVLATALLGAGTLMAALAARRTIQHMALSERAHISGGYSLKSNAHQIFPTINNFSKTTAFVTRVSVRVCPPGLPQEPMYPDDRPNSRFVGYEVPPYGSIDATHVWAVRAGPQDTIFYGGIWYRDVFGDEHFSGFIIDLADEGIGLAGHSQYWRRT
jgi:hypothetical protein